MLTKLTAGSLTAGADVQCKRVHIISPVSLTAEQLDWTTQHTLQSLPRGDAGRGDWYGALSYFHTTLHL
ncbi:hypothetical protein F2P79_005155 [Pimephales promelas]|nr:hypothetical protein F2P79_005155 [Pimephales promelas]